MQPDIWRSNAPFKAKMEATTHMTCNYSYLALILLCFLVMPICTGIITPTGSWSWNEPKMILLTFTLFFFATVTVCAFYIAAEMIVRPRRWWMIFVLLIPLLALGVGMAVNNAKAVLEAVFGQKSEFVRTPKFGESKEGSLSVEKRANGYKAIKSVLVPLLELTFGIFFLAIEVFNLRYGFSSEPGHWGGIINFVLMSPFLGFFYTGVSSLCRVWDGFIQRRRKAA